MSYKYIFLSQCELPTYTIDEETKYYIKHFKSLKSLVIEGDEKHFEGKAESNFKKFQLFVLEKYFKTFLRKKYKSNDVTEFLPDLLLHGAGYLLRVIANEIGERVFNSVDIFNNEELINKFVNTLRSKVKQSPDKEVKTYLA